MLTACHVRCTPSDSRLAVHKAIRCVTSPEVDTSLASFACLTSGDGVVILYDRLVLDASLVSGIDCLQRMLCTTGEESRVAD